MDLTALEQKVAELEKKLNEHFVSDEKSQADQKNAASDELSSLTEAYRKLKAEKADLEGDLRSAQERCTELERQLAEAHKNKFAEQYADLEHQYNKLKAENAHLKAIIDEQERVKREAEERARREAQGQPLEVGATV